MTDPVRPADEDARAIARDLLRTARFASLGVVTASGVPMVTRIALALDEGGMPMTLISSLSQHTECLVQTPACSLLVGEPGPKGDPLTHPRLTLQARAVFVARDDAAFDEMRASYLRQNPKAKLYIDFADFSLVRMDLQTAFLNGGFGKAFTLTRQDLLA